MVPIGEVNNVHALAEILGCNVGSLPMTYLGMSLGASHKSLSIWNSILEKIERKLARWKLYLLKGARLTLLKSTLSSLPTYFLSLFTIPTHVANKIEKMQRDFLWGDSKTHLLGWDKVCKSIAYGSLGIRKLTTFNKALQGKWLWRFTVLEEGDSFEIWGRMGGGPPSWGVHGCGLWRSIRMGWEAFSKNILFKVGEGNRVKFRTDRLCRDLPLHLAFLVLYKIATNRAALVDSSLICQGEKDKRSWDVHFIRGPNDWEANVVDDFFGFLVFNSPSADDGDRMRWKLMKNGDFNIRSFYHKLCGSSSVVFP